MSKLTFEPVSFSFSFSEVQECASPVSLLAHVVTCTPCLDFHYTPISVYPTLTRDIDIFIHSVDFIKSLMLGYDIDYVDGDNSDVSYWCNLIFEVNVNFEDSCYYINVILSSSHETLHSFCIPFSSNGDFLRHPVCLCDFLLRHGEDDGKSCI